MNQDKMQLFESSQFIGIFLNFTVVTEGHSVILVHQLMYDILYIKIKPFETRIKVF